MNAKTAPVTDVIVVARHHRSTWRRMAGCGHRPRWSCAIRTFGHSVQALNGQGR
jgi:hypothetical protein